MKLDACIINYLRNPSKLSSPFWALNLFGSYSWMRSLARAGFAYGYSISFSLGSRWVLFRKSTSCVVDMIRRFDVPTLCGEETKMNFIICLCCSCAIWWKSFWSGRLATTDDKCSLNIDLHFIKKLFDFRSNGEVLVEIEEVLKQQLLHWNGVGFTNRKSRHLQCLLNSSSVVFVRCK